MTNESRFMIGSMSICNMNYLHEIIFLNLEDCQKKDIFNVIDNFLPW